MLTLPLSIITADWIPGGWEMGPEFGGDFEAYATHCQISFANYLKVRAIDRSSDELFRIRHEEKAKQQEAAQNAARAQAPGVERKEE
jgi:hypothetical protein